MLDTIVNAQGGAAVQQLGAQFGLGQNQTVAALAALVPALAAGVQQNAQSPTGMAGLLAALSNGQHQKYVDTPSTLADPATTDDGNGILGHLFGSKDVSRQVASQAAAQTGVGSDVLQRMLPVAATLVMGALAKHATSSAATVGAPTAAAPDRGSALMGLLNTTLTQGSQPGSMGQNVIGLLGGLLRR